MPEKESLEPPAKGNISDSGARQTDDSESEDSFTDAHSGPGSPSVNSPGPKTQNETVEDTNARGEVPGTEGHRIRREDPQSDEMMRVSDSTLRQSTTAAPTSVVEGALSNNGSANSSTAPDDFSRETSTPTQSIPQPDEHDEDDEEGTSSAEGGDDDFGDDFDDFEEGAQEHDDFDDFEEGFQEAKTPVPSFVSSMVLPFPMPDFDGLSPDEVLSTTEPLLDSLFPPQELDLPEFPTLPRDSSASSVFLTPRSASLWSQLVAPPPLAPPDWIRSRTRRLFLVSLGVPVDLDEILPASKQKKLILPSLKLSSASPRTSSDSRSVSRLRHGDGNASSTSVDSQGKTRPSTSKRQKGPPPQPDLDVVAGRHLCLTTDQALDGMTDEELAAHVGKLKAMEGTAKEVLEYWRKRTDEKIGDREAFEGVIENLVKHARKVRK